MTTPSHTELAAQARRAVKSLEILDMDSTADLLRQCAAALESPERVQGEAVRCNPSDYCAAQFQKLYATPPTAPAQDAQPEWATCASRGQWVRNGLEDWAKQLRDKEKRCRNAYTKPFMGEPARYVADAYGEAAAVFEARLAAIVTKESST